MAEPRFHQVVVDVDPGEADVASSVLFDLGAVGLEERDATTLARGAEGKVTLVASFDGEDAARAALSEIAAGWSARPEVIVGDAFLDEWKRFFHPFTLCPGLVVRPPWEPYEATASERVLELEPGRAFGTGLHETTSLVAEALRARPRDLVGASVLDVGCGSGILSLVALMLGAREARSIDVDPEAVKVTQENAARNGFAARVLADTTDVAALSGEHGVVVANIEARVLIPLAEAVMARTAPGGLLVLSGVLAREVVPQEDDVRAAYGSFALEERAANGQWVALVLRAPR